MIDSVMKNQEPQMNADERRFVVPAISSSKFLMFENHREHRGHREKWQPSEFSVYSVVDCPFKYSIFQKKLKSFTNIGNRSKPPLEWKIFDHILKRGGDNS